MVGPVGASIIIVSPESQLKRYVFSLVFLSLDWGLREEAPSAEERKAS